MKTMTWWARYLRYCICIIAFLQRSKAFSTFAQTSSMIESARSGMVDARQPIGHSFPCTALDAVKGGQRQTFVIRASFSDDPYPADEFDLGATMKYATAILLQVSLIGGLLYCLDRFVDHFSIAVPIAINIPFFYAIALKSRVFNPLSNERPKPQTLEASDQPKRNMPSWTPPGIIFPIMWLLIIGPIRAISSAMIYAATGHYACLPLLALILHLCIGDVWNTINNVERRYGVAVIGVLCVWLSNAHAAYQFWTIDPLPGKLLAFVSIWLTIAACLVTATWRINPDSETGKAEPLYPVKGKAETKFVWFK